MLSHKQLSVLVADAKLRMVFPMNMRRQLCVTTIIVKSSLEPCKLLCGLTHVALQVEVHAL